MAKNHSLCSENCNGEESLLVLVLSFIIYLFADGSLFKDDLIASETLSRMQSYDI